jgi:pyridinium-3,5-bisthiocarboxylic acid mononucleotide nickel chelatase
MTIVYFDCFAGASGDMLLASLLDAGAQLPAVLEELKKLPLSGYEIKTARVMKRGISALDVTVAVEEKSQPHRHFSDIAKMLRESGLTPKVLETSLAVFTLLAQAEGKIHGRPPEKVHFHEVGAVDSIVDIVGIAAALENLGVKAVYSSPLHVGSGTVRCAHGTIPVPAPATLEVLSGVPVYSRGIEAELLTPTGASVLAVLATFGPMPAMHIKNCGYGAGKKDLEIANIVRAVLGEASNAQSGLREEEAVILEANIDDLNPEIYGYVMEKLFAAGALDVYLSPIQMKKNRPGTLLRVLAGTAAEKEMLSILFRETTTLGVRRLEARKLMLERSHVTVDSAYGSARVKIGRWDGEIINAVPEYEDCLTLARQHSIPLKEVYRAVTAAYNPEK